jgi:glycosyltransferase involved in cell wall biosynthesis
MKKIKKKDYYLTIAYTTYNRKKFILNQLRSLININLPDNIEIIVIDNFSNDGTFVAVSNLIKHSRIKIYHNNKNIGFAGNFVEAFKRAKGKYIMWASDKDGINFNDSNRLFKWMDNKKTDVVMLNYFKKDIKKYESTSVRKNKTRLINYDDLLFCSHLPGTIWNRKKTLLCLKDWHILEKKYPETTKYYPNLLLLIKLMPFSNSYFFNGHLSYQREKKEKGMSFATAVSGEHYSHLASRWLQHKEFINLIESQIKKTRNLKHKNYLCKMQKFLNENLYELFSRAILEEKPNLHRHFSNVFSPFFIIKRGYKFLKTVFKSFLDNPMFTIYRIKARLKLKYKI